jgi:hypothetical protein
MIDVDGRLDEILNYLILRWRDIEADPKDTRTFDNTLAQLKQLIAEVVREARLDELQSAKANAGGAQNYYEERLRRYKAT